MKKQLYICNSVGKEFCSNCHHSKPHESMIEENDKRCGCWGDCFSIDYDLKKVRCVKVK